uniref:Outer capsid protein VP2 n=1 Tax=Changuinola virus TaxID=40052 RepID=A0A2S0NS44_9REOV|nr:VP2 [Changuinola virus]
MTTEFTIAVADINKAKCQDALFNEFDIVIDTSNKAMVDDDGKWMMDKESQRRNIYLWGTDQPIDNAIKGIPGNESYLCIANNIDSVLGELTDENLENRDKIQHQVSKELKWGMNMQSQEWASDIGRRSYVECKFGNLHARDHHFESLVFYRNPIPTAQCSHAMFHQFYDHIYSDLHHIVQNTIYLVDYTYKIQCVDNEPYRYSMGIIFPYRQINQDKFQQEQDKNIFSDKFNKFTEAKKEGEVIYIDKDLEIEEKDFKKGIDLDEEKDILLSSIKKIEQRISELENSKFLNSYVKMEDLEETLNHLLNERQQIKGKISNIEDEMQRCRKIKYRYVNIKQKINEDNYKPKGEYDYKDSELLNHDDVIDRFNGSYKNALKKKIIDGKIQSFETLINMQDKKLKNAEEIQKEYDKIGNQDPNIKSKWLDIKRSTFGYYSKGNDYVMGYGPLKIEGNLTPNVLSEMRKEDKYKELIKLIYMDKDSEDEVDAINLCKLFSDYSRSHMNYQIKFSEDEDVCRKFQKSLNLLFNQGKRNEQAAIKTIHDNGWTVHPINVRAFKNIDNESQPIYYKNVAKLGILISQVYGGYIDNNCPIHALRGGMLYINSLFGNVYDMLKKKFKWDIYITDNNMGWQVPKDSKIRPFMRMNVYENNFIRGRAGVCWNFFWNTPTKVNVVDGYPHYNEESPYTESSFNEQNIIKFYQAVLNSNKWDDVHIELDNLLKYESQFYIKNITNDFYLDDKGILVTPPYYGEQIYYNVIANCYYKCVATQTNNTTVDKNEFKHTSAQRLLVPDIWFKPFQDQYDKALICQGNAINTKQQIRGRLERTYVDAIARNADFREYMQISESDIIDNMCPITYSGKYIVWKFYAQLFSLYVNFMPIHIREKIQMHVREIILYPEVQKYDVNYDISSICMGIYSIFIHAYNAVKLTTDRDVYLYLRNYQSAQGNERLYLLKRNIPTLYDLVTNFQGDNVDEYFALNFLFLLSCSNINSDVIKETYVPICYCRSSNIIFASIKLTQTQSKNFLSKYLPYMSRFFGIHQHKRWRNKNEISVELRRKAVEFYIGEVIINISTELSIRQTKSQNVAMWIGSKCGGVSEAVLIFQAITYPKAGYILIVLGDENMDYDRIYMDIKYNYHISFKSCKGVVMCKIKKDSIYEFKVLGSIKARKMLRTFWGLSHDMILVKSPGDIFGNAHIVTKLMNI